MAILIVYGLSCHSLAAHLYSRWLQARGLSYNIIYAAVMGLLVLWGLTLFDARMLFSLSLMEAIAALALGLLLGLIASWADRTIVRHLARRQLAGKQSGVSGSKPMQQNPRVRRIKPLPVPGERGARRDLGLPSSGSLTWRTTSDKNITLVPLLLVAVLEEFIYRGLLIKAVFLLPPQFNYFIALALAGSVIMFALAHISFGWPHVVGKLPLGGLALLSVLLTGSVWPAVIAHLLFNFRIWHDFRNRHQMSGANLRGH